MIDRLLVRRRSGPGLRSLSETLVSRHVDTVHEQIPCDRRDQPRMGDPDDAFTNGIRNGSQLHVIRSMKRNRSG